MIGVLKTLLIFMAFYYGFKLIMRFMAPFLMKYAASKMEQKMKDQFQGQQQAKEPAAAKQKKSTNKVGEYIDFEEIE